MQCQESRGGKMADPVAAIDLGGTRMRAAIVSSDGNILDRSVKPTPRSASCPDALISLLKGLSSTHSPAHAVIGVPGRVDYGGERLAWAPNLPPSWVPALAQEYLSEQLEMPVALANDTDLAAVGEFRFGAGAGRQDVVYLTFSTGVGAGVVLGGRLVHGRYSLAEVGHTIIDRAAAGEQTPATLEDLASGTALNRRASEAGLEARGATFMELVDIDDPIASDIWVDLAAAAGIGAANLAHIFSPEVIVVGGGLGLTGKLIDPIKRALNRYGPRNVEPVRVVLAALGDDAGLAGGAGWDDAFSSSPGSPQASSGVIAGTA
jgi:glucokinase